jgi:hypothetical protein
LRRLAPKRISFCGRITSLLRYFDIRFQAVQTYNNADSKVLYPVSEL